jgi:hypothetical protein
MRPALHVPYSSCPGLKLCPFLSIEEGCFVCMVSQRLGILKREKCSWVNAPMKNSKLHRVTLRIVDPESIGYQITMSHDPPVSLVIFTIIA